jgi:hypothetical protein
LPFRGRVDFSFVEKIFELHLKEMGHTTIDTPHQQPEQPQKPSVIDALAGRKRIGTMTPDEYLKFAKEAHNALAKPATQRR